MKMTIMVLLLFAGVASAQDPLLMRLPATNDWHMIPNMLLSSRRMIPIDMQCVTNREPSAAQIEAWSKDGVICKVMGHYWELGCGVPGCAVRHSGDTRTCVLCKKLETRTWEWK